MVSSARGQTYHSPPVKVALPEIEDLAGIRVITFFLDDIQKVESVIYELFEKPRREVKGQLEQQAEKIGYQSVHFVVTLSSDRLKALELPRYAGMKAEIQVRTILQHAWAEIEHDIQYKSPDVENIPPSIRRRFAALAGLLEIADREFQAIQYEDVSVKEAARHSVQENRLDAVEITPDALKAYLDKLFGKPDGRMATGSYDAEASLLRRLGFRDFRSIDRCIAHYGGKDLSSIAWLAKQGQVLKFETLLLAAMGENFLHLHPRHNEDAFKERYGKALDRLRRANIPIGERIPEP